jgi:hypothetical protein
LIRAIRANPQLGGAFVNTPNVDIRFDIQAYADDVVFMAQRPDGMGNMLAVLQDYTDWARMDVNTSKCATASYVTDAQRRRTYLD